MFLRNKNVAKQETTNKIFVFKTGNIYENENNFE